MQTYTSQWRIGPQAPAWGYSTYISTYIGGANTLGTQPLEVEEGTPALLPDGQLWSH